MASCWAIIIVDYFEPFDFLKKRIGLGRVRKIKSDRPIIDALIYTIHKILNCSFCLSYHIFWISYLIYFGSPLGLILGVFCYFITHIIKNKIMTITL
jgi:hypothetical protein